jgi:excisionase family DNA binding protein
MSEIRRRNQQEGGSEHKGGNEYEGGALLLTMIEAARVLSIGRTTMYDLVGAGEIDVVHIGRSARVPAAALEEFVERQRRNGTTVPSTTSAARAKRELDPGQPTT